MATLDELSKLDNVRLKDDDEAEEVFEDADDEVGSAVTKRKATDTEPNLEESLREVMFLLETALNNRFQEAIETCQKWSRITLYHTLGEATLCFLKGALTLERKEVDESMEALKHLMDVCAKKRKPVNNVLSVIWKPNYNTFTDEEIHAELVYAEALLMISLMTFLGDQNLINLVKGAFRIRSCYQSYKECAQILEQRAPTSWTSDFSRRHFESGVRMGVGTFNLMISHMPSKVLKLLEFIGFSGNRSTGFVELEAATSMTDGLRSPLAVLISMTYHCYVEHYFGLGEGDLDYVKRLLDRTLEKYPTSAFFLMFAGRISQLRCELDEALEHFRKCVAVQNQWKQLHNVCYWESLFCHAIRCEWDEAAGFADLLRKHCNWSPATYTYQYATFLYMSIEDDETKIEEKAKVNELIKSVPGLRIRYAGKTIPCEKFAIVKSEKYIDDDSDGKLVLPAIEFLYIWNFFTIVERAPHYAQVMLDKIESKLQKYSHDKDDLDKPLDHYALCVHLKGMCLRTLGFPLQAEECYLEVIEQESRVHNMFLPAHAAMELGLTYVRSGDYQLAKHWLEKVRRDYSGYLLETVVHFRIHCALRTIKIKEKEVRTLDGGALTAQEDTIGRANEPSEVATANTKCTFTDLARKYQSERSVSRDIQSDLNGL